MNTWIYWFTTEKTNKQTPELKVSEFEWSQIQKGNAQKSVWSVELEDDKSSIKFIFTPANKKFH